MNLVIVILSALLALGAVVNVGKVGPKTAGTSAAATAATPAPAPVSSPTPKPPSADDVISGGNPT